MRNVVLGALVLAAILSSACTVTIANVVYECLYNGTNVACEAATSTSRP